MRHHYTVKTYEELQSWAAKFANDEHLHSLVIFGSPGTGKTETFTRALDDQYLVPIKGRLTAFQLYQMIRENPDALFLFDDTRRILRDCECINLLMALGEHKSPKVVQWNTSTLKKDHDGDHDPNKVETRSRILLVINKVDEEDEDLEPLFSRSVVIRFAPSKEDVHRYVGEWFPKDERSGHIYRYIGNNLGLIPVADVRDYTKSATIYDMNWKEQLHESWTGDEYLTAALRVVNDPLIMPGKPQVEAFFSLCGGSRAQFFRLKRLLMPLSYGPVSKSHRTGIRSRASPGNGLRRLTI